MIWATLAIALLWAAIHLFAAQVLRFESVPRSRWLSLAGGASVAYVFVHLLPELSEAQGVLAETGVAGWLSHHAYLVALGGLSTFYGLERMACASRGREQTAPPSVFWTHVASFSVYNALLAYLLLHREDGGPLSLALYATAMGLHFIVTDQGLRAHHRGRYHAKGRWILAAAIFVGWGLSVVVTVPETWLVLIFAFLAGGVVLNVLKEELPEERQSRFWAFAVGAAGYAGLLLAV